MQTSFTLAAVNQFLKTAKPREIIYCAHIPGFSLFKTIAGGSYRYRYTALDGKRREKTIGSTKLLKPAQAAEIAARWRNDGVDPLHEQQKNKQAALSETQQSKMRVLGDYIQGPYKLYQSRKSGRCAHANSC